MLTFLRSPGFALAGWPASSGARPWPPSGTQTATSAAAERVMSLLHFTDVVPRRYFFTSVVRPAGGAGGVLAAGALGMGIARPPDDSPYAGACVPVDGSISAPVARTGM